MDRRQFITLLSTAATLVALPRVAEALVPDGVSKLNHLWAQSSISEHGLLFGIDSWADFNPGLGGYRNYYSDWTAGVYKEQSGKPQVALGNLAQKAIGRIAVEDFPKKLLPGELSTRAHEYYTPGDTGDIELRVRLCSVETAVAQMVVHVCEPNEEDGSTYSVVLSRSDLPDVRMYINVESLEVGEPAGYVEWGSGEQYVRHEIPYGQSSQLRDFINKYMQA